MHRLARIVAARTHILWMKMKTQINFLKHSPLIKTVWAVHIDTFYVYVMIRATSIIPSNYKRVSGTCAFIAFTRAPGHRIKGPDAQ